MGIKLKYLTLNRFKLGYKDMSTYLVHVSKIINVRGQCIVFLRLVLWVPEFKKNQNGLRERTKYKIQFKVKGLATHN